MVSVLEPLTQRIGQIMGRLEVWLENRSPIGFPSVADPTDNVRGEQLFSDLAPGMLTDELLADWRTDR
jgi:hypothetical protein